MAIRLPRELPYNKENKYKGAHMIRFIKPTLIGGILFLVPIVIFVAVIGKALTLTGKLATPLAKTFFADTAGELILMHILSFLILVMICFFAGLLAKTLLAKQMVKKLETNFLDNIPAYALIKAKTQSSLNPDEMDDLRPAIVRFDDSWQLAFKIERLSDGKVVIFLPGSPDPWSGSVCVVTGDRVTSLAVTVKTAADMMKRLGRGSADTLQQAPAFSESQT
jgi:uncharacterized membrane protein